MSRNHPKLLLVEGSDDLRVIPELIESCGIVWETNGRRVVQIEKAGGYAELCNQSFISAMFKRPNLESLGIIIDADSNPAARWQSIRNACQVSAPEIPDQLPETGALCNATNAVGEIIRFGIWMMPDNQQVGMIETFLAHLVPEIGQDLWAFACECADAANKRGASFEPQQRDKANLYTWLAWQEPPGRQLHDAVKFNLLSSRRPAARRFARWFADLYQLPIT